jgi:hypothetical protein
MYSEGHLLRFSMPTHTHLSDTRIHSYGHFSTATCRVSGLLEIRLTNRLELLTRLQTVAIL